MQRKPPFRKLGHQQGDHWFVYERRRFSFQAVPIHWKGWASSLLIIGVMTGLPHLVIRLLPPEQTPMPGSLLFAMAICFAIGLPALIALIKAKGRPAHRD